MTDDDINPLNEAAKHAASLVNLALAAHERDDHDGEPCPDERLNMLAYLAHRIGVRRQDVEELVRRIVFYHQQHQKGGHE